MIDIEKNMEATFDKSLKEKAELFNLDEKENKLLIERYSYTLATTPYAELKDSKEYLETQGITITKAREVKVLAHSIQILKNKCSLMGEAHEMELYRLDPVKLNLNAMDLWKKIKYCNQINVPYKNEDGTYKDFLFDEKEFQEKTGKPVDTTVIDPTPIVEEAEVKEEAPVINESTVPDITMTINADLTKALEDIEPRDYIETPPHIEMSDYSSNNMINDFQKIENNATSFSTLQENVKRQMDALNNEDVVNPMDMVGFNDIEPETFNAGFSRIRGYNDKGETRRDDAA